MDDPFRPREERARAIYDAFQREAAQRNGREYPEWVTAERQAVLAAARIYWPTLPFDIVIDAETYALGSTDYGAKWAYRLVDLAQQRAAQEPGR